MHSYDALSSLLPTFWRRRDCKVGISEADSISSSETTLGSRQISIGSGPAERAECTRVVGPGRFGPSRKKEAAARRFGNYELWVLKAAVFRRCWWAGRRRGEFCHFVPSFAPPQGDVDG
jgi:hypothetical protein